MAAVEVFVDDAVRRRLPKVCVKTGAPANGYLRIIRDDGGIGATWLLVFLGPIGWIALLLLSVTSRRRVLTVRLPYCTEAVDREVRLARARAVSVALGFALTLAAVLRLAPFPVVIWGALAVAAFVVAAIVQMRLSWVQVGIRLDASGRWITLSGVHEAFVEAVSAERADVEPQHDAERPR